MQGWRQGSGSGAHIRVQKLPFLSEVWTSLDKECIAAELRKLGAYWRHTSTLSSPASPPLPHHALTCWASALTALSSCPASCTAAAIRTTRLPYTALRSVARPSAQPSRTAGRGRGAREGGHRGGGKGPSSLQEREAGKGSGKGK